MSYLACYLTASGIVGSALFARLLVRGGEILMWQWALISLVVGIPLSLPFYFLQQVCR